MSLAERQQRAYDSRQVSVLESLRAGVDPFTAAINAIRGVRIPYNKGKVDFGDIFGGIVDGVGSYFNVNTTGLTNLLRGEKNYNIAGGTAFGPGGPVGFQLLGALKQGQPNSFSPVFIGANPDAGVPLATGSAVNVGKIDAGRVPAFESFWGAGESAPVAKPVAWGWWVAIAAVIGGAVVMVRR